MNITLAIEDKANTVNKNSIKVQTARKVFRTIQKYGPIERKQIQEHTNLSWGAVSQSTSMLIRSGILVQNSNPTGHVGKIPYTVDINTDDNYLVGIDLHTSMVKALLFNLKGEVLESRIAAILKPEAVIHQLITVVDSLLASYIHIKNILLIGFSAPGNIDSERGILKYLVYQPSWKNLEIVSALESRFQIPTFMFHDPDCIIMAEKYFGIIFQERYKNACAVYLDGGAGMSTMINSKIFTSRGNNSGELGHTTAVPGGTLCNCGKRGCLEMYVSKHGIVQQYAEALNRGEASNFTQSTFDMNYESIRLSAEQGDPLCRRLFLQAGELMGRAFASLASILEPEAIILYGDLINHREVFQDILEETFQNEKYPHSTTKLLYSKLDGSAPSLGAAFYSFDLMLDNFLARALEYGGRQQKAESREAVLA
ncbi:ROK family protein [Anaerolentibacter hominis]|uniref:ROK family protein n=1 Tax=Anaerolentibacter hominis TaxID=3079009 RepID=UPI0031B89C64